MIAPVGSCPACSHPWAWHPSIAGTLAGIGCTAVVYRYRQATGGRAEPCGCSAIYPGHVHRDRPEVGLSELELRALWGDR